MQQLSDYKTTIHQEDIGKDMNIKHTQKVDHILDTNSNLRSELGSQAGKDTKLAARIPLSVIHYWENHHGLDMSKVGVDQEHTGKFWRLLQDPQYKNFRIWEGRMV